MTAERRTQRPPRKGKRLKLTKAQVALVNKACESEADIKLLKALLKHITECQISRFEDLLRSLWEGEPGTRGNPDRSEWILVWNSFTGKRGGGIWNALRHLLSLIDESQEAVHTAALALKAEPTEENLNRLEETIEKYHCQVVYAAKRLVDEFNKVDARIKVEFGRGYTLRDSGQPATARQPANPRRLDTLVISLARAE